MQENPSDVDQVEEMLKKTGCIDLHYKVQVNNKLSFKNNKKMSLSVTDTLRSSDKFSELFWQFFYVYLAPQECIAEAQDWRKCQEVVKKFRECMVDYTSKQRAKYQ